MANIKVKDLNTTTSITSSNQLMVLTDDTNNVVQNITINKFNENIISTDSNNGITQGADGNLYVNNADTGVTAGTYQYPQNLVVNAKGKITSVQSGSPASVPIATTSTAGIVKPDGSTVGVQNDGTISVIGGALPSQTGNAGKVLTTDGTDASWGATAQVYPVVETYISGSSWYRIYAPDSTGYRWCAQGGIGAEGATIIFLKEFASTYYTIILTDTALENYGIGLSSKTTTDFVFGIGGNTTGGGSAYWQASGYIVDEV